MNTHAVLLISVSALVTALIRFAPFLVFRGGRETPAVILRLGKLLPCAVMSMLVVYCLRNMDFAGASHALPEIIAAAVLHDVLEDHYSGAALVSVAPLGYTEKRIAANTMAGSDRLQLIICGHEDQVLITALFDNLGKGASGAAVQNMNLMLGLEETTGLNL